MTRGLHGLRPGVPNCMGKLGPSQRDRELVGEKRRVAVRVREREVSEIVREMEMERSRVRERRERSRVERRDGRSSEQRREMGGQERGEDEMREMRERHSYVVKLCNSQVQTTFPDLSGLLGETPSSFETNSIASLRDSSVYLEKFSTATTLPVTGIFNKMLTSSSVMDISPNAVNRTARERSRWVIFGLHNIPTNNTATTPSYLWLGCGGFFHCWPAGLIPVSTTPTTAPHRDMRSLILDVILTDLRPRTPSQLALSPFDDDGMCLPLTTDITRRRGAKQERRAKKQRRNKAELRQRASRPKEKAATTDARCARARCALVGSPSTSSLETVHFPQAISDRERHSLRFPPIMKKRPRPKTPSTPPTPQTIQTLQPILKTNNITDTHHLPFKHTKRSLTTDPPLNWVPLNLGKPELFLPLTFPTGQTFRWKQTGPFQFTGVLGTHLISLKQLNNGSGDVAYHVHTTTDHEAKAREALVDFLNVGVSLVEIWGAFSASDSRITKMVDFVSALGDRLGTVEGLDFYEFPSLDRLALVSKAEFRAAGFGYRAKYIVGAVEALQSKPGGGAKWLASLRDLGLCDVIEALSTLPGVGPKVAACIALFSLDQHHAVPVDTHVWQIATRYLTPELAGVRLTPKLCNRVAEAFVIKYGKYAGWAQTVLFIAELPSQKALLPSTPVTTKKTKTVRKKDKAKDADL
ncbi:hypothetical protein Sjap_021598 [Stephania japonica]|uniref:DNA-(apurinic or apyrimidinic site) lyase n=1 Tax=Stephania japonica TaxID=461633 RepID=A0AAP0EMR7_9MAGN